MAEKFQIKRGTKLYHFGYGPLSVECIDKQNKNYYLYCRILDWDGVPYRLKQNVLRHESALYQKVNMMKESQSATEVAESGITLDAGSLSGESGLTEDIKNEALDSGLTKDSEVKSANQHVALATVENQVNTDIPKYVEFDLRTVSHWVFINEKDVLNEDFAFVLEDVQPSPAQLCPYFSDIVHKRYVAKYKAGRNYTVDQDGVITYLDNDDEAGITKDIDLQTGESIITADIDNKDDSGITKDNAKKLKK